MAIRPFYTAITEPFDEEKPLASFYNEEECDFKYFPGLAVSQKKKSVESLHSAILMKYPSARILEVSTKSSLELGRALSAFNLKWIDKKEEKAWFVESIYQGSKCFEEGGPYRDLFEKTAQEAKTDPRLKNSGKIKCYMFQGKEWSLSPPFMFYDYLYIRSLNYNTHLHAPLMEFDTFTDIEFNNKKSLNCQARAVAIFVTLKRNNLVEEYLRNKGEKFGTIYETILLV